MDRRALGRFVAGKPRTREVQRGALDWLPGQYRLVTCAGDPDGQRFGLGRGGCGLPFSYLPDDGGMYGDIRHCRACCELAYPRMVHRVGWGEVARAISSDQLTPDWMVRDCTMCPVTFTWSREADGYGDGGWRYWVCSPECLNSANGGAARHHRSSRSITEIHADLMAADHRYKAKYFQSRGRAVG